MPLGKPSPEFATLKKLVAARQEGELAFVASFHDTTVAVQTALLAEMALTNSNMKKSSSQNVGVAGNLSESRDEARVIDSLAENATTLSKVSQPP